MKTISLFRTCLKHLNTILLYCTQSAQKGRVKKIIQRRGKRQTAAATISDIFTIFIFLWHEGEKTFAC
jgi:hypothetical protein